MSRIRPAGTVMDFGSSPINSSEGPSFSLSPTSEHQQLSTPSESAHFETCWTISSECISSAPYRPSYYAVGDPEPDLPLDAFPIIPSGEDPHAIPSGCPATRVRLSSSPTVCVQPSSVAYSTTRNQVDGPRQVIPVRTYVQSSTLI